MGVNDDQELEAFETLSLSDFPLTNDHNSGDQDHHHDKHHHNNPPSPATEEDLFEFYRGGSSIGLSEEHMMMSHAEDMISGGKLIPINNQPPPRTVAQHQNHNHNHNRNRNNNNDKQIHRYQVRCESMRELKSTKGTTDHPSQLVFRTSHSLDHKKLNRNSKLTHEPSTAADINRSSLSNRSCSSRWSDLVFGQLKVPPEMDLKDIRNRQTVQKNATKSLFPTVDQAAASDRFSAGDHRKTSWGVIGLLSCKRSGSVAMTMPLS